MTDAMNDETAKLKEFKEMISEKTVPKSLKILRSTILFLFLLLIVLAGIDMN